MPWLLMCPLGTSSSVLGESRAFSHHAALDERDGSGLGVTAPTASPLPNNEMIAKKPPVMACTLCRQCKAKCVRSPPESAQCDRCKAAGCLCVVEKHKRGRKRTRGLDLPRLDRIEPLGDTEGGVGSQRRRTISDPRHAPHQADDRDPDSITRAGSTANAPPEDKSPCAANPLPFISGADRPFSLRNLLHPSSSAPSVSERPTSHARPASEDDLVSRGLLSENMAQRLFGFFMDTLNPLIMLFDPSLHTFRAIRGRSRFLFATILAAAARFVASSIVTTLAGEVKECSTEAVMGAWRTIETVQSWMVIFFYKAPRDDRGWTYVGLLCRLAVEIGLDRGQPKPTTGSDDHQREQRNRARTWMLAYMMDRAVSSTTGRDWCLRGHDRIIQDPRSFSDHPLRLHGDAVIAGFAELRRISSQALDHFGTRGRSATVDASRDTARFLLTVNYDLDEWMDFWQDELRTHQSPERYWAFLRFFELHVRLTLNSFAVNTAQLLRPGSRSSTTTSSNADQYCFQIAIANLTQIQVIRNLDISFLQHAQDSISIMVAYAACFLRLLVNGPTISPLQRNEALELIQYTSQLFKTVGLHHETTAALQAEYLGSLLARDGHSRDGTLATLSSNEVATTLPFGQNSDPAVPSQGPYIDITDFDAWMSAFELETLPNPTILPTGQDFTGVYEVADTTPAWPVGSQDNADWDAIFLSWLNPDPPGQ